MQAAKKVEMSYSTAKKIYGRFRKFNIEKHFLPSEEKAICAHYVEVPEGSAKPIPIVCLIAGNIQNN